VGYRLGNMMRQVEISFNDMSYHSGIRLLGGYDLAAPLSILVAHLTRLDIWLMITCLASGLSLTEQIEKQ
jgi:hypothetical protein